MSNDIVLILTTVPDDGRAESLARTLVEERLAACVNLHGPMTSVYRWKGAIESERERQVVIKTTRERVAAVEARLREIHSYEVPEIIALPIVAGSKEYLSWINEETR